MFRGLVACLALASAAAAADPPTVAVRADFPGGNVKVLQTEPGRVRLAPDLRGGPAWFHWHFEATADRPGAVAFAFAGSPLVGSRGPAVSRDGGKTWAWLGTDTVTFSPPGSKPADREDRFTYSFTAAGEKARFAVAIPYLQRDLDAFLAAHAKNPLLAVSELTRTRVGRRPVELMTVGKPGPGVSAVLLTARHHACESMASFVVEGFVAEVLSDSPAAAEFRKRHVLYVVPMVDKDGVEDGDQGKNRPPHDHNRDYGKEPIYPEVQAIQELAAANDVRYSLDVHCPYLRGDVHDVFHWMGLGLPHIKDNVLELTAWVREEKPPAAGAPANLLVDPAKPNAVNTRINSHYFAVRPNNRFAATLEVPYSMPGVAFDQAMARAYGAGLVRAWNRTRFLPADATEKRDAAATDRLAALRAEFQKVYRGKPQEAEKLAAGVRDDARSPAVLRAEANNLLAVLRLHQKKFADARSLADEVSADPSATTAQREAAALRRSLAVSVDPASTAAAVDAEAAAAAGFPHASAEHRAKVFEAAGGFHERAGNLDAALGYARKQYPVAAGYERGKVLNRTAALLDGLKRPADAAAARREAVTLLRKQLDPVPVGVFGATMAADLLDAVTALPSATDDEKRAAARIVLGHKISQPGTRERATKLLAELDGK